MCRQSQTVSSEQNQSGMFYLRVLMCHCLPAHLLQVVLQTKLVVYRYLLLKLSHFCLSTVVNILPVFSKDIVVSH